MRAHIANRASQPRPRSVLACAVALALLAAACAPLASTTPGFGSQHQVRMTQPPAAAAECFARNAEAHSGALVSEVRPQSRSIEVIVRVRNGVTYATAEILPSGSGSVGRVALNVVTTAGASDLLQRLTEGC